MTTLLRDINPQAITIVDGNVRAPASVYPCEVHIDHGTARPLFVSGHHIHPKEWGGDPQGEILWVCEIGHQNIHSYMYAYVAKRTLPRVARKEKAWAVEGLKRSGRYVV